MSTIRLTWNSVEGAVSYNIYHANRPGVSVALSPLLASVNGPTFDHVSPSVGHHYYIVAAMGPNGEIGPPSNEFSAAIGISLVSIAVTPTNPSILAGNTQQFTAIGTYNDSSTADITSTVTWTSGTNSVGTIDSTGLFTAILHGTSVITATLGVSGNTTATVTRVLASLVVTPANASVNVPNTQQYTATGHYNDGSTADITGSVTWASSNTSDATIDSGGLLTAIHNGSSTISATIGLISNNTSVTINRVLSSIVVTPTNLTIVYPNTQQYTATGHYNDGTTQDITSTVTWASTDTNAATIASGGLLTVHHAGTPTISATLGVSGSTGLTVTVTLVSIAVTPANTTITSTGTQQYTATGTYNDSSTADITGSVTWASSTPGTATISGGGLASGVAAGSTTISATSGLISGNTGLTVSAGVCGFAASPTLTYGTSSTNGVYVASDGLNAWTNHSGANTSVNRSTDGGQTWTTETVPAMSGGSIALLRGTSATNIFIGVNGSSSTIAYLHSDGSGTWTSVAAGTTTDGYTYAGIQSVVGDNTVLYGVSRNFGPHHYILKSTDNGTTWSFVFDAKTTGDSVSSNSSCAWYDTSTSTLWVCGNTSGFGGVVWKYVSSTLTRIVVTAASDTFASIWANGSNVYTGGNASSAAFVSIWHSNDSGSTWSSTTHSQLNGSAEIDYIYGNSPTDIYVLGSNKFSVDYGMILHGVGNNRWIDAKTGNANVPGGTSGAVNHYSVASGTSSSETLIGGDGYLLRVSNCSPPTITGISPSVPGAAGTNITITGTNFDVPLDVIFGTIGNATTKIKSTSNGQTLPQSTINVLDTGDFASAGIVYITTDAGIQQVTYTSKTSTTFAGCTGGTGTMSTNNLVELMNITVSSTSSIVATVPTGYTSGDISVDTLFGEASFGVNTIYVTGGNAEFSRTTAGVWTEQNYSDPNLISNDMVWVKSPTEIYMLGFGNTNPSYVKGDGTGNWTLYNFPGATLPSAGIAGNPIFTLNNIHGNGNTIAVTGIWHYQFDSNSNRFPVVFRTTNGGTSWVCDTTNESDSSPTTLKGVINTLENNFSGGGATPNFCSVPNFVWVNSSTDIIVSLKLNCIGMDCVRWNGSAWSPLIVYRDPTDSTRANPIEWLYSANGHIYAGCDNQTGFTVGTLLGPGIAHSSNNGVSFTYEFLPESPQTAGTTLALSGSSSANVWTLFNKNTDNTQKVYYTTGNGIWTELVVSIPPGDFSISFLTVGSGHVWLITDNHIVRYDIASSTFTTEYTNSDNTLNHAFSASLV